MNKPLLEICIDSVASAISAEQGGAARVELCQNLFEGGTTPSIGTVYQTLQRVGIKVNAIIRPRGGDFLYSSDEFEIMKRDIVTLKEAGINGVVIGMLNADGSIDTERTQQLIELARPLEVTFHRAFDVSLDPFRSLENLIDLGVDRLLTSGQEPSVLEGVELIAELVRRAGDDIIIMPGAGITAKNLTRIIQETGAKEYHVTGSSPIASKMEFRNERCFMGKALYPPEFSMKVADPEKIRHYIDLLNNN
ncbi:MAG: copper homeostasis protein CutC [Verrucomicrobiota bacterium]|nr:copper homeostasis protein CutC [Verrucomicrobiota bacterium]MED5454158.1 copper homeostasis protein CutC [Verrucomicrobiota bacterium]|tara:strand:+ start:556 stop:1305 length:750 start_codon:yes stop_codon:yes gene_type:complete